MPILTTPVKAGVAKISKTAGVKAGVAQIVPKTVPRPELAKKGKKRLAKKDGAEPENSGLPDGYTVEIRVRSSGATAGIEDPDVMNT